MSEMIRLMDALGVKPLAERQLPKAAILFSSGDRVSRLFIVRRGRVRLERIAPDGAASVLYVAGPGQSFAEASLFSSTYHCDAIAAERAEIVAYSKPALLRALRQNSEVALDLMAHLARQVQGLRTRVGVIHIQSARERILAYIWSQLPAGSQQVVMSGTWKAVASEIHLAHETVYREMARLEREGVLVRDGMRISFP